MSRPNNKLYRFILFVTSFLCLLGHRLHIIDPLFEILYVGLKYTGLGENPAGGYCHQKPLSHQSASPVGGRGGVRVGGGSTCKMV